MAAILPSNLTNSVKWFRTDQTNSVKMIQKTKQRLIQLKKNDSETDTTHIFCKMIQRMTQLKKLILYY
jgi:predicted DNA-binding protein